jgi:hypothetical protein
MIKFRSHSRCHTSSGADRFRVEQLALSTLEIEGMIDVVRQCKM